MRFFIFFTLLATSFLSMAGQYTGSANITRFANVSSTGEFPIMGGWDISKAIAEGCTNNSKWIIGAHKNFSTPESINSAFSLILAAYTTNKTVEFYIEGCNAAGQPIVAGIWFPSRN